MTLAQIGILNLSTRTAGIGGVIKQSPEDFVVQEISAAGEIASLTPKPDLIEHGSEYTDFTLVKKNWDQPVLLKKISDRCGVSKKRFHYAGTKDKFALTSQRISAWKVSPKQLSSVSIRDCAIGDFSPAEKRLELGDLWGNRFAILVKNINLAEGELSERVDSFFEEIKKLNGVPNFFGEQRFGLRLNNHIVGKELLKNNIEAAIKHFLTDTIGSEREEGKNARIFLRENWGSFSEALKKYPVYMRHERALLNHLVKFPSDYVGAFKKLHKNTYKLFTHAYQAYLFNRCLSYKIEKHESLSTEGNLAGYNSELSDFEQKLLSADGLSQPQLKIPSFPEASVSGSKRKYLAEIKNISYSIENGNLKLSFGLVKGAYATVLLRELMKDLI